MRATFSSASYSPVEIIGGNADLLVSTKVTLAAGQNLTAGAVLGRITTGGQFTLSASAASNGSQVPDAILAHDTNTTAGAAEALVYTRGDFIANNLTFGAGHTAASTREGLRAKGIILLTAVE
jgi:hypothetical protein